MCRDLSTTVAAAPPGKQQNKTAWKFVLTGTFCSFFFSNYNLSCSLNSVADDAFYNCVETIAGWKTWQWKHSWNELKLIPILPLSANVLATVIFYILRCTKQHGKMKTKWKESYMCKDYSCGKLQANVNKTSTGHHTLHYILPAEQLKWCGLSWNSPVRA